MIQILTIRDYNKDEHPLLAVKTHTSELNGNEYLELTIHQQKNNDLDLLSIDKLWEIDYQNITYKIINIKKQTRGESFYLTVNAKPLFYWEFSKSIIHENHDGSHTANSAFRTVFEGTGYNFVLVDFSPSVEIEGFGKGENRLELFKRLLDRYNYEFEIQGSTIYMRHMIGSDTNYMYKYKLNASNVSSATDASGYFTHIKGFGDFDQGEEDYYNNAKLKREYTHPLAGLVGKWEGPPIVDGRVNQRETLDAAMKKAVDESLQISIEGTLHDIRRMGYETAVPKKGDRVWLHDERINLEQEIRLYSIATTYDERDNIVSCDVTFGSQSIRERRKAELNSLSKNFRNLLTGQLKLPVISLEKIGMDMINAIHAASSEIIFGDFGMQAISKTNPNHVFGLNSEGWYISQDGGRTPRTIATAQGIYADALFAGTLWLTNEMNIESVDGFLNMSGSLIRMRNSSGSRQMDIQYGEIESIYNGELAMKFGGYSLEFYNQRNDQIGRIAPTYTLDEARRSGLAMIIEKDVLNIGYQVGTIYRPILRSDKADEADGKPITTVNGPFNDANSGSRLNMYANRRIVSSDTPFENDFIASDQPSILMDQGSDSNDITQYFGGANRRRDAEWRVRFNASQDTWASRIIASSSGVRLGASSSSDGATGNRFADFRTRSWQDNDGVALTLADGTDAASEIFLGYNYAALINRDTWGNIWVGGSGSSAYVRSMTIQRNTTTLNQDYVQVSTSGTLRRITSSRRYKLDEKEIGLDYAKKILSVDPKTWFDKNAVEKYANHLNTGEIDDADDADYIGRIPGVIAEDLHDVGLNEFVVYDEDNRPNSVNHNLPMLMLPVVKDHDKRVERLEDEISELIKRLERYENGTT